MVPEPHFDSLTPPIHIFDSKHGRRLHRNKNFLVVENFLQSVKTSSLCKFVEQNPSFIAKNSSIEDNLINKWSDIVSVAAKKLDIKLSKPRRTPPWNEVLQVMNQQNNGTPASSSSTTSETPESKATSNSMNVLLSLKDKNQIKTNLSNLLLKREIVDKIVADFATQCNYHHPSQSLILDLGDINWESIFSEEELDRLDGFGDPMFPCLPDDILDILNTISSLETPLDAYNFARELDHDPVTEPLKSWISIELPNAACHFFHNHTLDFDKMLEYDQLYKNWGFLKTVIQGSNITEKGSEGSSKANGDAKNRKRSIPAIKPATTRKMGHNIDTIYSTNGIEVGCIEVGKDDDQTKSIKDGLIKMPIIMHDMLTQLAETEEVLRKAKVLGYVISSCSQGTKAAMLVMDSPAGFISRIRRSKYLGLPTCSENFTKKIVPLFKLALTGLIIMENTRSIINNSTNDLESLRVSAGWRLPPTFIPSSLISTSKSSTTASSSAPPKSSSAESSSSSKKQKTTK
ncbi:hypothetical protein INT45_012159 [Circinella minor]|uniref:Uncharacterized protein n=1 Tax=Circinella minor TaxID=1195481 RepID=A0A8H7SCF6_9FUNG|nr:hypothetical protein INT45_012159 [Circinella minor]